MPTPLDQRLPSGTVTFLFTDIQGSTRLWQEHSHAMHSALAQHDALLHQAIAQHDGHVFKTIGDALCAAFATAPEALNAALAAQRALAAESWPTGLSLPVRMALHTGAAELRDNDYFGPPLNRVKRLLDAGHGEQVLLSAATYELVQYNLPAEMGLRDLGEHRLKDLGRSETIFQLLYPTLPSEFPPLCSLEALRHNLPQQLTSFIGREQEMVQVKELLAKTRLLSLTGSGGTGKTRLSLQVAAEVLEQFPDGVWLVELAPVTDPALLPQTVAGVLGVRETAGEPLTKTLLSALKEQKVLLVLDNCEHLLEGSTRLVDALLHACPKLKVLLSSREALGISGERVYRVPSLSLPDPRQAPTPQSLPLYTAVQLFIERAVAVKAEFAVTNHNAPAVAGVCQRLDGIPLALELAAARLRSLSVEELEQRLSDRFRLLTGGSRTALPRQQTLRAMIDWSYDLLEPNQQQLLARLSVFAGGWSLEAAEAVGVGGEVEAWEVLDLLTALTDKSLVLADEPQEGCTRYRLLETVRQYARERLASDEAGEVYQRQHRDYFLVLAETSVSQLIGPQQAHWLEVLEIEHDNLRGALTWCLEQAATTEGCEKGLRLGRALQRFWSIRGYVNEGRERLTDLLALPGAQEPTPARAMALRAAGNLAHLQGDYASTRSLLEESLTLFKEWGDSSGIAACLDILGNVACQQAHHDAARLLHEKALVLYRELGDKGGIASCLCHLGNAAMGQSDPWAGRSLYEESLAMYQEMGDNRGMALIQGNLGCIALNQGDYSGGRSLFEESLTVRRTLGDKPGIANCLHNLAAVASSQGDGETCRSLHEESLLMYQELGDRKGIALCLLNLGEEAHQRGDYAAARPLLEQSLVIYRNLENEAGVVGCFDGLGRLLLSQGDLTASRSLLEQSLGIGQQLGNRTDIVAPLHHFASLNAMDDKAVPAVTLWGAVQKLRGEIGSPLPPHEQEEFDRGVSMARGSLGEEAFFAAWAQGQAMSWQQAVQYALSDAH
jgi:predicted ATPase/class 3 adenylate cyclase